MKHSNFPKTKTAWARLNTALKELFWEFTRTKVFWCLVAGIIQAIVLSIVGWLFSYFTGESPLIFWLVITYTWSVTYLVEAKCQDVF